jgi:hypothetical protein
MRIRKDALKGYILEEVLAYLVRTAGYNLLVDPSQDERDLGWDHGRFVVRERGGVHQVDVLGQLSWIPAFTFPLRLFIEAKFRNGHTQIRDVRNAVGVILDINQNNSPTREQKELFQKYQYVYALFSTSGFSEPAIEMAIAHQISLIDLSGSEFHELGEAIELAAKSIIGENGDRENRGDDGNRDDDSDADALSQAKLVSVVREAIRLHLRTWPEGVPRQYDGEILTNLEAKLRPLIQVAREYGELLVAMANGPFMLLLKADNIEAFFNYVSHRPQHKITISWSNLIDNGRTWAITPVEQLLDAASYRLTFRLPERLAKWIFGGDDDFRRRARLVKEDFFSDITIYRYVDEQDYLYRLQYDAKATRGQVDQRNRQYG